MNKENKNQICESYTYTWECNDCGYRGSLDEVRTHVSRKKHTGYFPDYKSKKKFKPKNQIPQIPSERDVRSGLKTAPIGGNSVNPPAEEREASEGARNNTEVGACASLPSGVSDEELKTLKDIFKKYRLEWSLYNGNDFESLGILQKELKAKAVKWVKDDRRRIKQGNINVNILSRKWMRRLDITEKDLQEEEDEF